MSAAQLAWGILGAGKIAHQYADGLNASDRNTLVAVGSRQISTADAFAAKHQIPRTHGSYDALLADPAVQAIYISLPNSMHHEWTIKALRAGKHVLCEKPMATNLAQLQEMFDEAKRAGRVLAEAFMYRSHPLTHAVHKAVKEGRVGKVRVIRTSFIYSAEKIAGNVRFSSSLAGGSLMDIGCYCLSYSRLMAGSEPESMQGHGHIHESGVDDYAAAVLKFPGDIVATFACGMTVHADNTACVMGDKGYIEVPLPWKPPSSDAVYTLVDSTGSRHTTMVSSHKHLYTPEADDFAASVIDGAPLRVSQAESLGNQHCLDVLRRQIGVAF
ncbi:MAG TPA: Gfo/Idh/MocA family oxidoreductase [Phycisphaerae bacterium]